MDNSTIDDFSFDDRIAARLKALRLARGWSLDDLAGRCSVSRATLSRLENGEVSPTAAVLGKLCAAYAMTMSRLMAMVETAFQPMTRRAEQNVWEDPETGFRRRSVSPPSASLAGEVLECELPAGATLAYEKPARPGLEHHLVMLAGHLEMKVGGEVYELSKGDCLRYQLFGPSVFQAKPGRAVKYLLAMV